MPKSDCVIPSPVNGGGGDSQSVVVAEALGLGRGVLGSPSAGLVKGKVASEILGQIL